MRRVNKRLGLTALLVSDVVSRMSDEKNKATKREAMSYALACVHDPKLLKDLLVDARRVLAQRNIERVLTDPVFWDQFSQSVRNQVKGADAAGADVLSDLTQLDALRPGLTR